MSDVSTDNRLTRNPATSSGLRVILNNRGFLVCLVLLATFTVSFEILTQAKGVRFRKERVDLKKPLRLLDQHKLNRSILTLDPVIQRKIYAGRISPGLLSILQTKGLSLSPDTNVTTKEEGALWILTEPKQADELSKTFLIRKDENTGKLTVLAPYELLNAIEIKPEVLDSLGTDQYIQWLLYDPSNPNPADPARFLQLFVTYYTGTPDQVPHVPEECYVGGGGFQVEEESFLDIPIPTLGKDYTITVKVLEFGRAKYLTEGRKIVMYLFHTNGRFCPDRMCTRLTISNPSDTHAYFSKLELTFGTPHQLPTREQAIESGKRFLQVVIPVILEDHWPDWDQVIAAEKKVTTSAS